MKESFVNFSALALLISCGLSTAADWPQFRGPDGQGRAEVSNLPTRWTDTENVAWKKPIPGAGWASPIIYRDRIYLTTAVPVATGNQSLRALCLDARDGKIRWNTEVFSAPSVAGHRKNGDASPTPLTDGERLYVHFGPSGTGALDLNGRIIWRNTGLKFPSVHGNGGSPALAGNALVFTCDGSSNPFIVALNKATGETLWRTPRNTGAKKTFSFSTPLVITNNGQVQVVSPTSGAVIAYDPRNGKEIWRVRYPEGYSVVPRPVFGQGLLFVSSAFDRPVVYAIRPDGKGDVTDTHVAWSINKGAPNTPSPLLVGSELYFVSDSGIMTSADAKSGKVHWQERVGGNYSASPVFADGKIFVQSEEGVGSVLQTGKVFKVLATNDVKERTLASYALDDGAIFIRTANHLFRIRAETKSAEAK
jgi:outer membrane protein assembly factor BamB